MIKEIITKVTEAKLKNGNKIKMLEPVTFKHLSEWTNGSIESSNSEYIEKGEVLTISNGEAKDGGGSSVAVDMLDELEIKYKKI